MNTTDSARVVVIEDEPIVAAVLAHLLTSLGHTVSIAPDGASALALLQRTAETDLIMLDRRLPDIDGLDLLDAIKADGRLSRIPVILATSLDAELDEAEGFARGCADYVSKPFRPAVVAARVRTQLSLCRARDSLAARNQELEAIVQRRTRELVLARDAAELASDRKTEQLAQVGAELAAPVRALVGVLGELEVLAGPVAAAPIERLRHGVEELSAIIDGLHAPGVAGADVVLARHAGCQTRALAREIVAQLLDDAEGAPLRASIDVADDVPAVVAFDGGAVRRVLLIVLRNALRAIRDGRVRVRVGAEPAAGVLLFSIRASSDSAPQAEIDDLFLPLFETGGASPTVAVGAGWAHAKRLVGELSASLAVVASGPHGSSLVLSVPVEGL